MGMRYLFIILIFFAFACGKKNSPSVDDASTVTPDQNLDAITEAYMKLLNEFRHDQGLDTLAHSQVIADSSQGHSQNMARKLIPFGHLGSSSRCSYIQKTLQGGNLCGEVVAMGQRSAEQVFNAWKNSPGHRSVMVNVRYTHAGLGYARNSDGTLYWTQIFLELK